MCQFHLPTHPTHPSPGGVHICILYVSFCLLLPDWQCIDFLHLFQDPALDVFLFPLLIFCFQFLRFLLSLLLLPVFYSLGI